MLKDILKKVRYLEISANNKIDSLFAGNYRSAFKGRGVEFADIRPYDTGDDVRDIDWKTTSKQGELFVKTYHESRDNTLFFLIDGSPSLQFSSLPQKKYERLLETFSLLAFSAVKNGDRVGILFYGNGEERIFPPKKGRRNVLKILKFCIEQYKNPAKTKKNKATRKKEITRVLRKVASFLKHSSTVFWFLGEPLSLSTAVKKNIKILRLQHDIIPFVFSDPIEDDLDLEGEFSFQDSFSGEIKTIQIDKEVQKNYQKIRTKKKRTFQKFFQKQKSQTVFISAVDVLFKKLYLFFQQKQQTAT